MTHYGSAVSKIVHTSRVEVLAHQPC